MSLNSLKRTIVFSNEQVKSAIEQILEDEAAVNLRSVSSMIEAHLCEDLLPAHATARIWIELMMSGEWGIGETLTELFAYCGTVYGPNCRSRESNVLPVVQFTVRHICFASAPTEMDYYEVRYLRTAFDSIIERIRFFYSQNEDYAIRMSTVEIAAEMLANAEETGKIDNYVCLLDVILQNWDAVSNLAHTFSFLSFLVSKFDNWRTNPHTRLQLLKVIREVSAEWGDE